MIKENQKAFDIVKKLFKNDYGEPFEMTEGQIDIFRAIYEKQNPRIQIECYTQYGKSDITSMAVLLRASTFPEKWPILGGTKEKAGIIMEKVIKHLFENDYTLSKFKINPEESLERIKRERSKERITFKVDEKGNIGEVFILSAETKKMGEDAGNILIGYGAPNLIEDDSALMPDRIHGKAMRMLGGHKENFLLKISNTFNRNHFLISHNDQNFKKITIDFQQGIKEGRITPEYIEEMRGVLDPIMFGILYECKFPPEGVQDSRGWTNLFTESEIESAMADEYMPFGVPNFGADPSEGKGLNESVIVIRHENIAKIDFASNEKDLMDFCAEIDNSIETNEVDVRNAAVDMVGPGAMIPGKMKQSGKPIQGINVGEACENEQDKARYADKNAYLSWKAKLWIKGGGKLFRNNRWYQLFNIKYKTDEKGRMKMMPKDEMRKQGINSPDAWDALKLTFYLPQIFYQKSLAEERFNKKIKEKNKINKPFKMTGY